MVPTAWQGSDDLAHLRIYNPAITRFRDHLLMAYRIDSGHRETMWRIGLCELNANLNIIPGSMIPISYSL